MNPKIHQLCKTIAQHPSQINLLNQALTLALTPPSLPHLSIVIQLIEQLAQQPNIQAFLANKLTAIFIALLQLTLTQHDPDLMELIAKTYDISCQKTDLAQMFLTHILENQVDWSQGWPGQLIGAVCEEMVNKVGEKQINWQKYIDFILSLPPISQIKLSSQSQLNLKKNFQKLLLTVLASPHLPEALLHSLYHGLTSKVIQKMSQPLALANHCLDRFAHAPTPQLQIEVLSCLFLLVGKYGLELQKFYQKLQTLIRHRQNSISVYELPNSKRFFKLLEASLRSSRVPFKTVSTFAHILIRQIPTQTGEFAFWALSFIVNLTKKHRKLLDELPLLPQLKAFKYHYNPKIRSLIAQLSKNLNLADYLDIEDFTKLSMASFAQKKLQSAISSLQDQQLQFRLPAFEEPL